ncbi:MAG: glycoside hydrolase N-terminal domain-containing protein [Verrucomicrobiota bacterium]
MRSFFFLRCCFLSPVIPAWIASLVAATAVQPLELRFAAPATNWEAEALPVGNGRIGAMIYGDPLSERMQFNDITLWTGGANPSGNYDINNFGAYQNFGDLYLGESSGPLITWPSAASHATPSSNQTVAQSADGNVSTKWCFVHNNQTIVWQAEYPEPKTFTSYALTSADDVSARDPKAWTLEGSNDGTSWTTLDSRSLGSATTPVWPFPSRNQTVGFTCTAAGAFNRYRFTFAPNTTTTHFQVAEIQLIEGPGNGAVTCPSAASHLAPSAGQTVASSVDKNITTKWCFEHKNQTIVWQVDYLAPIEFTRYKLTSAEDVPIRDPRSWTLEGSNNGTNWTVLDSRSLSASSTPVWPFPNRRQTVEFIPSVTGAFSHYRFVFAPNTATTHFQVAEISLERDSAPQPGAATNVQRVLDIADAVHRVTWTRDGVNFLRETFASHPHEVIATRISASQSGKVNATLKLVGAHSETSAAAGNELGFAATLANNGLRYATRVRAIPDGGTMTVVGNTLKLADCDAIVILHAAATDYALDAATTPAFRSGIDPATTINGHLNAAQAAGYQALKTAHLADFHSLFNRVTLDLGAPPAQPLTPNRLTTYKAGGTDNHLESLLFQYGRYLLISSSRGSLPANLQGLWNNSNTPPWNSDYHVNINLQMNYWSAEPTNLGECHLPLFRYLAAIAPLSRQATKASFGAATPGWTMRTSVNPFGGHGWNWDTPSSGWVARHFWEHYLYSKDEAFLRATAWPAMKEICQFWIARLIPDANGKLVAPNGWSPEHGPTENGVSYVQEIVWDLFNNSIAATDVLGDEAAFRAQLVDRLSRLLVPAIGPQGQVTEWANPATESTYGYGVSGGHRHTSHLYAVYPGYQFNPVDSPAYVAAAKLSLIDRGSSGDSRQSWTWPWRAAMWARMNEPTRAHDMVRGLLTYNAYQNFFAIASGVYQIDGDLGMSGAMSEMLLQSHSGEISVLPALPDAWPSGSFTGLRARGGFEVDAAWQNGVQTTLAVRTTQAGTAKLRLPENVSSPGAFVRSGESLQAITRKNGLLQFPVAAGTSYQIDNVVTGTADADGDGFDTAAEWLSGSDPQRGDSLPRLAVSHGGESTALSWEEIPDRTYELQFTSDLAAPWQPVLTRTPVSEGTISHPLPTSSHPRGFYRLVIKLPSL